MSSLQASGLVPFVPDAGSPLTRLEAQAKQQQLEKAGSEFESLFMSMLLKEMREIEGEESGLFGGEGSDVYGGLFDLMMGQSLSQNSPLNIAQLVMDYGGNGAGLPPSEGGSPLDNAETIKTLNSVI